MNYSIHPFCIHVIEMLYIGALNPIENYNCSPAFSKNLAVYICNSSIILTYIAVYFHFVLYYILVHALTACISFLQFIGSLCKMPLGEDGDFAKKCVVAQKNRYKDKFPCKFIDFILMLYRSNLNSSHLLHNLLITWLN